MCTQTITIADQPLALERHPDVVHFRLLPAARKRVWWPAAGSSIRQNFGRKGSSADFGALRHPAAGNPGGKIRFWSGNIVQGRRRSWRGREG